MLPAPDLLGGATAASVPWRRHTAEAHSLQHALQSAFFSVRCFPAQQLGLKNNNNKTQEKKEAELHLDKANQTSSRGSELPALV